MESMSAYMSWDPTLFDLDGYQSPVGRPRQLGAGIGPSSPAIRPDLQEHLLRDIDVGVDLVGRSLDHGFRALNDSISAQV
ncbi:hypothetical protein KUCAC02_036393 [Chaenocephalus aceratus]|nr:hypothetical protein KUCAC02_036393 [Chaenocephalus aceratus]